MPLTYAIFFCYGDLVKVSPFSAEFASFFFRIYCCSGKVCNVAMHLLLLIYGIIIVLRNLCNNNN